MKSVFPDSGHRNVPNAGSRRGKLAAAIGCAALAFAAFATPPAQAGSHALALDEVTVDELKRAYLACDHAAMGGRLDSAGIMQCSVIYEALKRRAFDGNFGRFLAWSRSKTTIVGAAGSSR